MYQILTLFDGSNLITRRDENGEKTAESKKLQTIQEFGLELNLKYKIINPVIFVDNSLLYYINNPIWLWQQIKSQEIFICESGYEADEYLLGFLKIAPTKTIIISNDKYQNHSTKIPELCKKVNWRFNSYFKGNQIIVPKIELYLNSITKNGFLNEAYRNASLTSIDLKEPLEVESL